MRDEWFRSSRWDAEERRKFEAKLARARPASRPQYLRLKGLGLADADDDTARAGARELFDRVIESDDEIQSAMARADLGRWFEKAEMPADAVRAYRACVHAEDTLRGSLRTGVELDLVELIVREHCEPDYEEAFELLDRAASNGLTFEVQRWRHAVASARLHARRGRLDEARRAAREALQHVEVSRPDFARHPNVGRIEADVVTLGEMKALAE
jgi:tetratricopeptide (TPR) repeat protein